MQWSHTMKYVNGVMHLFVGGVLIKFIEPPRSMMLDHEPVFWPWVILILIALSVFALVAPTVLRPTQLNRISMAALSWGIQALVATLSVIAMTEPVTLTVMGFSWVSSIPALAYLLYIGAFINIVHMIVSMRENRVDPDMA